MKKIKVLAVGPGSADYLPPLIVVQAKSCDLLVGGKRNLGLFNIPGMSTLEIKGALAPLLKVIREKAAECQVGVLVSGDPGIYSILPRLVEEFGRDCLEIYPGISAVQYMFARIGLTWQDARFISLHGRDLVNLPEVVASENKVVLFTDPVNSPSAVCKALVNANVINKQVYIGENLSYPSEKISNGSPVDFCDYKCSNLNLVVITND